MKIVSYDTFKLNESKILSFDDLHQYGFMKDPDLKNEFKKGEELAKNHSPWGILRHEYGNEFSISFEKRIESEKVAELIKKINEQNTVLEFMLVSDEATHFNEPGKLSEYIFELKGKINR